MRYGKSMIKPQTFAESKVKSGLSISPKDVQELTQRGLPVDANNASGSFYDGSPNCDFEIPLDRKRGVDIVDVFNESKRVKNILLGK